nr:RNA-directed DNA polymerase, eukaryota [Tanacetum cinerariifolium]
MLSPVEQSFRRNVRGGLEQQSLVEMNSLLDVVSLSPSRDRWFCDLAGDGEFRFKEVRNFIDKLFLPSHVESTRWVKNIPIKVNIFAWRARRDCLPTRANLVQRGVNLASTICPVCLSYKEDVKHVLFRCDLAQGILQRICRWWDLAPQLWTSFPEWQAWFSSVRLPTKIKSILEGVFYVAWWSIWTFRNRSIFEAIQPKRSVIFDDIVLYAFNWCHSRNLPIVKPPQYMKSSSSQLGFTQCDEIILRVSPERNVDNSSHFHSPFSGPFKFQYYRRHCHTGKRSLIKA